jgi:ABC-2 type transport system permease protein
MLLLIASLATGWKHYRELRAEHEKAQRLTRQQWDKQPPKNPHSAAHYGIYAFKPQLPLSYIDRGVDSYLGVAVWLEAHKQNPFLFRPAEDATGITRFGESTAAGVLQLLLPLVIILLSFSAFVGERERGTLKQVMSAGVRGRDLLLGKALGQMGALALLLVPAAFIGAAALMLGAPTADLFASVPRLIFMTAGYLLYFGSFTAFALMVSAKVSASRQALIILFAFWIINCLLIPRLAADVAERLYPTQTGAAFWAAVERDMKEGVDGHDPAARRTEELKQQVLKQYGVTRVEDLPINFAGLALQAGEEYGNQVFDRRYGELWQLYEKQNRVHQVSALVAPLSAVRALSAGLAGTDFAQHRDFSVAAEQYRRQLNKLMNEQVAYQSRGGNLSYLADSALWKSVPQFDYAAPGVGTVLRQQTWNFALLAVWFVFTSTAARFAVAKLKP